MAGPETLRPAGRLLNYPDEMTVEVAERLYVMLQGEMPEAAARIARFGAFLEQRSPEEIQEVYTQTFDINPVCALETGWHLFGEEYDRGLFLVKMREQLRRHGIEESAELPDHITHVLAVIEAMPDDDASDFVTACVGPAVEKMRLALEEHDTPYRHVVICLSEILRRVWNEGKCFASGTGAACGDGRGNAPDGDLLRAFPVAAGPSACGGCSAPDVPDLVPLSSGPPEEERKSKS